MRNLLFDNLLLIFLAIAFATTGCARQGGSANEDHAHGEGRDHDDHAVEVVRGPMGGRLFESVHFQLELRIEEEDGPPTFVAHAYDGNGELMSPDALTLQVVLERFANRTDVISFTPVGNHLRGAPEVREPHSFRAKVQVRYDGNDYEFDFEQHEFRVELSQAAVERAGIVTEQAAPGHIDVRVSSPGEVRLNRERVLIVRPRFPGVVADMRKRLGDSVQENEVLAVIQSNTSLTEYEITTPMSGRIVARNGMVGSSVDNESVLYMVADLSTVWVDFAIYPQHVGVIKRGQLTTITAATRPELVAEGKVSYVGPLLEEDTRVSHGRILLPNSGGQWQPGLYVDISAVIDHADVAVSVPDDAIIRSKFGPAVFIADGSTFELQPVVPGRSDGETTEIVDGLDAGELVVVENAYLLKAELGRGEATHDH
jgi:cobalt-zinc-cadmium efflux system membrane fusion protein